MASNDAPPKAPDKAPDPLVPPPNPEKTLDKAAISALLKQGGKETSAEKKVEFPIRRILIAGVSSYIGSALAVGLRDDYEVFGTYFSNPVRIDGVSCLPLDAKVSNDIFDLVGDLAPDAILYCIGLHKIDECEENAVWAEALNFKIASLFFKTVKRPIQFIYFSTDQVFGQALPQGATHFTEKDTPVGPHVYGTTKAQGESMVISAKRYTHVLRLANLYGEPLGTHLYPRRTWIQSMQELMERGQKAVVYADQMRSHLYIGDAVRAVKLFLDNIPIESRLYNFAGGHVPMSWADFARIYVKKFKYNEKLLYPTLAKADGRKRMSRNPNLALSPAAFEKDYNFKFQGPEEGLSEMYERLHTGYLKKWS